MATRINIFKHSNDTVKFAAGDVIFEQGDIGEHMYVVKEGEVEVHVGDFVLEAVETGGIFGEMALIDQHVRSAAPRAKTDCELVPVNSKRFTFLIGQAPMFALQVMRVMAERLRRKTQKMTES